MVNLTEVEEIIEGYELLIKVEEEAYYAAHPLSFSGSSSPSISLSHPYVDQVQQNIATHKRLLELWKVIYDLLKEVRGKEKT